MKYSLNDNYKIALRKNDNNTVINTIYKLNALLRKIICRRVIIMNRIIYYGFCL